VLGIGVGLTPRGVHFGAGASAVGAFCGVGMSGGLLAASGSAYVPFGLNSSFFLAPRFAWLEAMADLYGERARGKRERQRKAAKRRAFYTMWPRPMKMFVLDALKAAKQARSRARSGPRGSEVNENGRLGAAAEEGAAAGTVGG
jgi:hypothetical protein